MKIVFCLKSVRWILSSKARSRASLRYRPRNYQLIINLKMAKARELDVPAHLQQLADEE